MNCHSKPKSPDRIGKSDRPPWDSDSAVAVGGVQPVLDQTINFRLVPVKRAWGLLRGWLPDKIARKG